MRIDNYTRDLNSPLDPKEVAFCRKFEAILVGALEMEYGDVVRAFRQLEDEFVHRVDYNEWEVLETQRRIAEGILCVAHDAEQPFDVCRNNWNALVELGFSSIEMFCNMAWFYADCCLLNAQYDTGLEVLDMVVEEIHRRLEVPGLTSHAEKYYDTELDHLGTLREGLNAYKSSEAEGNAWDERRDAESEAQESSAQERQKNEIICKLFSATKPLRATSSDRGFDELVAEYRRAEAGFLERLESGDELFVPDVRRHFATTILEEAQQRHAPLEVCNAAWNELVRWGFGDLEHRCAVTRVYAECCLFNQQPDAGLAVVEPLLAKIQNDVDEGTDKQMSRQRYSRKIAHLTKLRDELLALKT